MLRGVVETEVLLSYSVSGLRDGQLLHPDAFADLALHQRLHRLCHRASIQGNEGADYTVQTPLYDKLGIPDAYRAQVDQDIAASVPLGRFGTPEEIANAVVYLASDESRWTVGSEIVVDGGRMLNG